MSNDIARLTSWSNVTLKDLHATEHEEARLLALWTATSGADRTRIGREYRLHQPVVNAAHAAHDAALKAIADAAPASLRRAMARR